MRRIQQLSSAVVNKIAAGEVIERPGSVVKELLENCVDALATRIEVDIAAGGGELIRVTDNGEGIPPEDLVLAIAPHATSKIRSDADLFAIQTLGFRGEALASIAEVSRFRLRSRTADHENGAELEVTLGVRSDLKPCGCPVGTMIEVRQLFENTPVRRKFMKTTATEFSHISEQFLRVGLANPRLQMTLRHNEKVVHQLLPTANVLERLELFFGKEISDRLIPIDANHQGVHLWGYVGLPDLSKATRKQQYLFLNGRWFQDRSLQYALGEAYRGLIMTGRYPVCFLYFEVPSDRIDVNVHPTKIEVRFQDSQQIFRLLLSTIRREFQARDLQSRLQLPEAKTIYPAESESGGQGNNPLAAEFAFWAKNELRNWTPEKPATFTDSMGPISPSDEPQRAARDTYAVPAGAVNRFEQPSAFAPFPAVFPRSELPHTGSLNAQPESWQADENGSRAGMSSATFPGGPERPSTDSTVDQVSNGGVSAEISGEPGAESAGTMMQGHPARALQIHDCYLVVETSDGLTVFDQHALHERILYERIRSRVLAGQLESQRLLVPQTVELPPREYSAVLGCAEQLADVGLGIEDFGNGTILVNRYPSLLRHPDLARLVQDVAEQLSGGEQSVSRRDILDKLMHMMSCKAAVKAGQRLKDEEIQSLLEQRHLVDDAHHCPHGRPTALKLSRQELDRQFGRLG